MSEISAPLFSIPNNFENENTSFELKTQIKSSLTLPPTKLSNLDLSNNRLTVLAYETLENWNQLKFLKLAGNPWKCNCDMLKFLPLILRNVSQTGINAAICSEPERLLNVKISEIQVIYKLIKA